MVVIDLIYILLIAAQRKEIPWLYFEVDLHPEGSTKDMIIIAKQQNFITNSQHSVYYFKCFFKYHTPC